MVNADGLDHTTSSRINIRALLIIWIMVNLRHDTLIVV